MSLCLHQIFYGDNKFDINEESIEALNRWAVIDTPEPEVSTVDRFFGIGGASDSAVLLRLDVPIISESECITPIAPRPSRTSSFSKLKTNSPTIQTSSVFWCMFVAHYGYSEYLCVGNRRKNRELEEKQVIMETLAKHPKQLKEGNMRLTHDAVQEILSTLMTSSSSDFLELVAYSHYYKKNVYVVFEHAYLVYSPVNGDDYPTIVLKKHADKFTKGGGRYSLDAEPTPELLANIRDSKVALEHFTKPFRGVSAYKVEELETFARKVGILADAGKKYKKSEWYALVVDKCCEGLR